MELSHKIGVEVTVQKVATVLNWLGWAAYQLHEEFDYTEADKNKLTNVLEKFSNYFKPSII